MSGGEIWLAAGSLSFVFLLLFDWRKAGRKKDAALFFAAGLLGLSLSTAGIIRSEIRLPLEGVQWFGLLWSAVWLGLYVYVLFFALPSERVYRAGAHPVCAKGIYGRCRHPGAWCFACLYLGLGLLTASADMWAAAVLFSIWNFLYVFIQDRWLFPRYIEGYREYRQTVPFLYPLKRKK